MLAPSQLAHHLLDDAFKLLKRPDYIWLIFGAVSGLCAPWVRKWQKQVKTRTVRDWLSVSASIDVVSVAERRDDKKHYYAAVLTYFYRRPDLQIGEYEREFPTKAAAQQWVKQFKGRSVMVHVNPQNPADSFLLDNDLQGLDTHQIPTPEMPVQLASVPVISHGIRFLTALGEQISIAGLAASSILLMLSLVRSGRVCPHWLLWTGGAMLVISFLIMIVVQFQCRSDESVKFLVRSYRQWTPAWMRWSLQISTVIFFLLWFMDHIRADLPMPVQLWMKSIEPHFPYFLGCWGFLVCASFHTAILRSQELVQLPVSDM